MPGETGTKAFIAEENGKETLYKFDNIDNFTKSCFQLASYGGQLHYTMKFSIDTSAPWQYHLAEADVILQVK